MPKASRKTAHKDKGSGGRKNYTQSTKGQKQAESCIANVNSNHIPEPENGIYEHQTDERQSKTNRKPLVKSKVVKVPQIEDNRVIERKDSTNDNHTETVRFEEDGEIIEMEIDDGGEAE